MLLPTQWKVSSGCESIYATVYAGHDDVTVLNIIPCSSFFLSIKGDEVRAEENKAKLEATLRVYDTILSKQKYLAGDVSFLPLLSTPKSNLPIH